jgi:lysyl-tRNA synthetase class II
MRILLGAALGLLIGTGAALAQNVTPGANPAAQLNDYPTVARADYVFGCMAANGQTRQSLEKCSCSIDTIATILPYDKYVEAETIMSMLQTSGQQAEVFRNTGMFRDMVADLRRAQAEAEVTCFY